jgi:hypothetical protein
MDPPDALTVNELAVIEGRVTFPPVAVSVTTFAVPGVVPVEFPIEPLLVELMVKPEIVTSLTGLITPVMRTLPVAVRATLPLPNVLRAEAALAMVFGRVPPVRLNVTVGDAVNPLPAFVTATALMAPDVKEAVPKVAVPPPVVANETLGAAVYPVPPLVTVALLGRLVAVRFIVGLAEGVIGAGPPVRVTVGAAE